MCRFERAASRYALPALVLAGALSLAGCEKTMQNMYDQPRYKPLAASTLWADERASRPPVDGTIAFSAGRLAGSSSGRLERTPAAAESGPTTRAGMLARLGRGRERFDIYCAPCHGIVGDGDGMVVRRGFPRPPSLHDARLRAASDAELEAAIRDGRGIMYPFADRVDPPDRTAIVAYIRALQFSRRATIDDVPPGERASLLQGRP